MRNRPLLRYILVLAGAVVGLVVALPRPAEAVACARGVYRAGCVGPRGAVVARRGVYAPRTVVYRRGDRRR